MSGTGGRTRREILADAAKAAAAVSVTGLAGCFPSVGGSWPSSSGSNEDAGPPKPDFKPSTNAVIEIFDDSSVVKKGAKDVIQADVVPGMLESGLKALAREVQNAGSDPNASQGTQGTSEDVDNPWKILLPNYKSGQRIGLKVNCLNPRVPTSGAIIRAIVTSLKQNLDIDPTKIIVWDRVLDELNSKARYTADDLAGAQLLGTVVSTSKATTGEPGYGKPYPAIEGETPRLSRIMTDLTDVTINVPVLKTHNVSGVTAAMKNIYGIIDIPGKYHKPKLQTAMPTVYALPAVRNSLVLTIVDALIGVVTGDTDSSPDISPKRILLAQDPVAMDNYALSLVNQLRSSMTVPMGPVDQEALGWIDLAHQLKLGNKEYSLVKASVTKAI